MIAATNLIEEISKSDLAFQLREGDKILNNSDYFELTKLQKMVDYLSEVGVEDDGGEGEELRPGTAGGADRRSSTVTLLSLADKRRGSVVSVVSGSSQNVLRLTLRTNRKRRLSFASPDLVKLPIVVVTLHQDNHPQTLADPAWEKGYKNFKFRSENLLNFFILSGLKVEENNPREGERF